MRQFLLAGSAAYTAETKLTEVSEGAVGVFYYDNGVLKVTSTGNEIKKEAMLVLGRSVANGGPVVIPIHKNKFSYVKGVYSAATTFKAQITITAPVYVGDHSIIVAKKGVGFNQRNKWTSSVHVSDTSMSASDLANKLAKAIKSNSEASGVTATVEADVITITALTPGDDYNVVGADYLSSAAVAIQTAGAAAYGDAKYVKDLADKAAADAGFEYTYRDAGVDLYPSYPINPLARPDSADTGFTIFTLKFAEPRDVKTVDDVINQIVQIAFPTGAAAISTFEDVCNGIAG